MKKIKARDHCHYTGKYRGAVHNICNLKYRIPKTISVVLIMVLIMTTIL